MTMARKRRNRGGISLVEVLLVIAIGTLLFGIAIPAIQAAREASRVAECQHNVRSYCDAFANYESAKRALPSSVSISIKGPLPAGARVKIQNYMMSVLPFLDDGVDGISLNQDFSEGQNAQIIKQAISNGKCPSAPVREPTFQSTFSLNDGAYGLSLTPENAALASLFEQIMPLVNRDFEAAPTDYTIPFGVSRLVAAALKLSGPDEGGGVLWIAVDGLLPLPVRNARDFSDSRLSAVRHGGSVTFEFRRRLSSVTDGTAKTLMIIEDAGRPQYWRYGTRSQGREPVLGAGWCDPGSGIILDGVGEPLKGLVQGSNRSSPYSFHPSGVNVGFADGHVSSVSEDIDPRVLVALFTPDGRDNTAESGND